MHSVDGVRCFNCRPASDFFTSLTASGVFVHDHWEREPLVSRGVLQLVANETLTWRDVVAAVDTGLVTRETSGGFMVPKNQTIADENFTRRISFSYRRLAKAPVSPIGSTMLQGLLTKGQTFFVNRASTIWPSIARVCAQASEAFSLPVNGNAYVSWGGFAHSAPLHSDQHDVLIVQNEGRKAWVMYRPEMPLPDFRASARQREQITALPEEGVHKAGAVALETTLSPGDVLYVPRGMLHKTHTACAGCSGAVSVSTTLGIHASSVGFKYDRLLQCALGLAAQASELDSTSLTTALFRVDQAAARPEGASLRALVPLGFLAGHVRATITAAASSADEASDLSALAIFEGVAGPKIAAVCARHLASALHVFNATAQRVTSTYLARFTELGNEPGAVTGRRASAAARISGELLLLINDAEHQMMATDCGLPVQPDTNDHIKRAEAVQARKERDVVAKRQRDEL